MLSAALSSNGTMSHFPCSCAIYMPRLCNKIDDRCAPHAYNERVVILGQDSQIQTCLHLAIFQIRISMYPNCKFNSSLSLDHAG